MAINAEKTVTDQISVIIIKNRQTKPLSIKFVTSSDKG